MIRLSFPLLLVLLSAPLQLQADSYQYFIGKPHPGIVLPDRSGKQRSLEEWRERILVVNFWATWCQPCRREIPAFNRLQKEYADKVRFIGVAIDNSKAVETFIKQIPIHYPVLIGGLEGAAIAEAWGNESGALPYTVIVDAQGRISSIAAGMLSDEVLRRQLDKLLLR